MLASGTPLGISIAKLASRQYGIVDHEELLGQGMARSTITHWVKTGRLHRIHRGVYSVVPPSLLKLEGRWMAAVRACGPGAVLSHGSAAQLHWLVDRNLKAGIHVSVPARRRLKVPGVIVHRPVDLPRGDIDERYGIPVTSQTRTVWDVASTLPPKPAKRAFERARSHDRIDFERLRELLAGSPRHRGAGRLRQWLASSALPLSVVRSWLEDLLVNVCSEHDLPMPLVNVPFGEYEVDFLWPDARFAVEADGGDHVGEQRDKDNARDLATGRAGILTRRYSTRDMSREDEVATEVADVLIERLAPGKPGA
ncbi:MAG: type IV toxin-antitoxin system AbiEi family antitoxin domain-containing protein [Solirubrobacterales bacterium]